MITFIGYCDKFIVENNVTWIEAVIAAPFFNGMVTYYIEGHKHHMMEQGLGQAQRSFGVRGNIFSYQMPWEDIMMHIDDALKCGENWLAWPHAPATVATIIRVAFKHDESEILKQCQELKVRAHIVHGLAKLYLERYHGHNSPLM